jgi:hypothetical protein
MTEQTLPTVDVGPLAAALAKAQMQFPPITRDKTVTVQTKTGGSYSFKYAPLDSILGAVRGPLSANGLVLVQMLDSGGLVTTLIHESGASLSGRVDLPQTADIQGLGSAITYLRRYAIQAVLGIAAEEDDDGNRAAGNRIVPDVQRGDDGSLIGVVQVGDKVSSDFLLRQTPEGSALGFRLRGDRGGILVEARGDLAEALFANRDAVVGQRVTVWGSITERQFTPKGKPPVSYQVLSAERVRVPDLGNLPADTTPNPGEPPEPVLGAHEAESVPLFSDDEQAAIDEALGVTVGPA